jgi:hypothetical protein
LIADRLDDGSAFVSSVGDPVPGERPDFSVLIGAILVLIPARGRGGTPVRTHEIAHPLNDVVRGGGFSSSDFSLLTCWVLTFHMRRGMRRTTDE